MSTTVGGKASKKDAESAGRSWGDVVRAAGPLQRAKILHAWQDAAAALPEPLQWSSGDGTRPWEWGYVRIDKTLEKADQVAHVSWPAVAARWRAAREEGIRLDPIERLGMAYQLPRWAAELPADAWWEAFLTIVAAACETPPQSPLADMIDDGELPWLAAVLCAPAPRLAKRLGRAAARRLSQIADTELDGNGLPHSTQWADLLPWLATWTRSQILADALDARCHSADAQMQYEWMVRESLRLTRGDGTAKLAGGGERAMPGWCPAFVRQALRWGGDAADETIAQRKQRLLEPSPSERAMRGRDLPEASVYSEWAEGAVLRSSWKRNHFGLVITHHGPTMTVELEVRRRLLLAGDIGTRVLVDGRPVALDGEWQNTCAFAEDGVQYLEFEQPGDAGWRLQRQIVFAEKARVLFWADALLGDSAGTLELRTTFPLAPGASYEALEETRDGWLHGGGRRIVWTAPLAAAEWRTQPSPMEVMVESGAVELSARGSGKALYLPWFLDGHRRRSTAVARTWRRLTVGENLQIVADDVAVGYRVQVDRKQWLFYRSLAMAAQRTVLGQHLSTEFFAGRFHTDGEVTTYVEVEAP